jgi:hypothetical protein
LCARSIRIISTKIYNIMEQHNKKPNQH